MLVFRLWYTHNKNIFTVGICKDDTKIKITLSGGALSVQGVIQGIYVKSEEVNGKPSWIMTSPISGAIWWYEDSSKNLRWIVGKGTKKGTEFGWLFNKVSSLPYVGSGKDWWYNDPNADVIIPETDSSFTIRTLIHGGLYKSR